jgi:TPR repeat protein
MFLPRYLIVVLFLLTCLASAMSAHGQAFSEQELVLTPQQVKQLTSEALDGSGPAALRLSRFYSNVVTNLDEAMKWAVIGAENGDANCQYTAYAFLDRRLSAEDRRRATFWLKKAADQGYQPAIEHIRDSR